MMIKVKKMTKENGKMGTVMILLERVNVVYDDKL